MHSVDSLSCSFNVESHTAAKSPMSCLRRGRYGTPIYDVLDGTAESLTNEMKVKVGVVHQQMQGLAVVTEATEKVPTVKQEVCPLRGGFEGRG